MQLLGEITRRLAKVFFVMVLGVSLTLVLVVELWWWNQGRSGREIGLFSSYQNSVGRSIAQAMIQSAGVEEVVESNLIYDDARPLLIERYLRKYKSPLVPYSGLIFELSETYGFEYYWIVAIAQQESNLCKKIPENSYNCWGYGIHKSGTLRFENYELALRSFAEYLKREYFDKGYTTAEEIMKKYCPHSDGSWARGVNQFIRELETGLP